MAFKRVDEFDYLNEFMVVVARSGDVYRAVGYEKAGKDRPVGKKLAEAESASIEDVTAEVKSALAEHSGEFFGFGGAINLFLKAFPDGFSSPEFIDMELTYKRVASEQICHDLSVGAIDEAIACGDYDGFAAWVMSGLQKTNLVSPYEKARFGDAMKKPAFREVYAPALRDLLHGNFDASFGPYVALLKSEDAASWPLVTYFPFLHDPRHHAFMKPEVMKLCALRLGFDLQYDTPPSIEVYRSLLAFTAFVLDGIATLKPEDNIDIQSFIYVVGAPGYVRDVLADNSSS